MTVVLSSSYVNVAAMVLKDNVYSYGVLLFTIEIVYLLRMKDAYWKTWWHIALLALSIMMVMLLRNNGKYLLYVFAPLVDPRYAFALIYSMPLLTAVYLSSDTKK